MDDKEVMRDIERACKRHGIWNMVMEYLRAPLYPPKNYICDRGHIHAVAHVSDVLKPNTPRCLLERIALDWALMVADLEYELFHPTEPGVMGGGDG